MDYTVVLFYNYVSIADPKAFAAEERLRCQKLGMKGRTIIAHEGINATYEGETTKIQEYITELTRDERFADTHFKLSKGKGDGFPRLSIKVRPEIVSLHLADHGQDIDPNQVTGKHLPPDELHQWFARNEDFTIIDMRNDYEHAVGHFKGSILPPLRNFRDLPKVLPQLEHLKDKKVLTVCTGGIRCEKASGYLVSQGFKDVHQLDGGMVSYMEKYPAQNFRGAMYVFDNRKVMDWDGGNHEVIGTCKHCSGKTESYVDCANESCHSQFLQCADCVQKKGKEFCCFPCRMRNSWNHMVDWVHAPGRFKSS